MTYEKYAEIRDLKGYKDSDISRMAHIPPSTFSEWKKGSYTPKYEKMSRIAAALGMEYSEFVGPVGKFSALNPNRPLPMLDGMGKSILTEREKFNMELIRLYHNATPDAQSAVMTLLKNSQKEAEIPSLSSKEA